MINKRKSGRTLDSIGIRWHNFDFQSEKNIYCYLCCDKMKKRVLKKLNEELKFVSYLQWKQYVYSKYENCNKDELIEFSRYLNQRIRRIKPSREYLNLIIPCLIPSIYSILYEWIFKPNFTLFNQNTISGMVITFSFVLYMFLIAKDIFCPVLESNIDANFLKDYKEIIDEIIRGK